MGWGVALANLQLRIFFICPSRVVELEGEKTSLKLFVRKPKTGSW
jgi:hypothetical protein